MTTDSWPHNGYVLSADEWLHNYRTLEQLLDQAEAHPEWHVSETMTPAEAYHEGICDAIQRMQGHR